MSMQSQNGEINLQPALPAAWTEGNVSDLKASGNFVIAMNWDHKELASAHISSPVGRYLQSAHSISFEVKWFYHRI